MAGKVELDRKAETPVEMVSLARLRTDDKMLPANTMGTGVEIEYETRLSTKMLSAWECRSGPLESLGTEAAQPWGIAQRFRDEKDMVIQICKVSSPRVPLGVAR